MLSPLYLNFWSKDTEHHWKKVKHLLQYIQGSLSTVILFQNHFTLSYEIQAYTDAYYGMQLVLRQVNPPLYIYSLLEDL